MHAPTNEHAQARTVCKSSPLSQTPCPLHVMPPPNHFQPSHPIHLPPPPNAARIFCDACVACPRAHTATSKLETQLHHRRTTISSQAPASRSICGSMHSPATSSTAHAYRLRATRRAPTLARHHAPPTDGNRRTASGARCVGAQAARSEARSACHASLHQYHRTPQPARVTVSVRRSRPPTGHRRAAGGDATTTAPPLPDRRATMGGF